jgi:hypothetical protein
MLPYKWSITNSFLILQLYACCDLTNETFAVKPLHRLLLIFILYFNLKILDMPPLDSLGYIFNFEHPNPMPRLGLLICTCMNKNLFWSFIIEELKYYWHELNNSELWRHLLKLCGTFVWVKKCYVAQGNAQTPSINPMFALKCWTLKYDWSTWC